MRIGVLGTGSVGRSIGSRLAALGHEVKLGSRTAENPDAAEWADTAGDQASHGTFEDAAAHGEILFNCTAGSASIQALELAGAENLAGKTLIDTSNALDFSHDVFQLSVANNDSLAEQIQRQFPGANVVKSLNTVNASVMVDPDLVPGDHVIFVSGDDAGAKRQTTELLEAFGWPGDRILDLGGIETARGPETWLHLWLSIWKQLGTNRFNLTIAKS